MRRKGARRTGRARGGDYVSSVFRRTGLSPLRVRQSDFHLNRFRTQPLLSAALYAVWKITEVDLPCSGDYCCHPPPRARYNCTTAST